VSGRFLIVEFMDETEGCSAPPRVHLIRVSYAGLVASQGLEGPPPSPPSLEKTKIGLLLRLVRRTSPPKGRQTSNEPFRAFSFKVFLALAPFTSFL